MPKKILNPDCLDLPYDRALVRELNAPYPCQRAFRIQKCKQQGLLVLVTAAVEEDGNTWQHVSFSRAKTMPDYADTIFVKQHFFGRNKKAIMVFPPQDQHVNIHPYCLHLWGNLTGDLLPDFRVDRFAI